MSTEQEAGRLSYLRSAITGRGPAMTNQYSRLGAKLVLFPGHFIRQEVLLREKLILADKSMDIEDRVGHADDLLTVIGQPYGRGGSAGNPAWTVGYNYWQDYMAEWRDRVSQRRWYKVERMVRVRDWVEVSELEENEDGTTGVKSKWVPVVRNIHEDTWAARAKLDELFLGRMEEEEKAAYKKIEVIGFVQQTDVRILGMLAQLGYDPETAEEALLLEGEKLLTRGMKVLNLSWTDKDTPGQAADVFMMQAPAQGQEHSGIQFPGQTVKDSSAQRGVHK